MLGTVPAVSTVRSHRLLAACLACIAVLAACTPGAGEAEATPTVNAAAVNAALSEVADARAAAADRVDAELRAGVAVEPLAVALRSPSDVDTALEEVPALVARFEQVTPADAKAALDRLDEALAAAEQAVQATRAQAPADSWQADYLAAQAGVLQALGEWSTASRRVHRVAAEHWELWSGVAADAAVLDEDRWRYRTQEEAAGTWEIEVADRLADLATASAAIGDVATVRDEAAVAVDTADRRAAEVFAERPTTP